MKTKIISWRNILKKNCNLFLDWLSKNNVFIKHLQFHTEKLEEILISRLNINDGQQGAIETFASIIKKGRFICGQTKDYDSFLVPEAYSFLYFLDRYSRMWDVLIYLTKQYLLPLGRKGIHSLEIGTGPACSLYAIFDFYKSLSIFGVEHSIKEFSIPEPVIHAIENSHGMINFFHHYSEITQQIKLFDPIFLDFQNFDLSELRYRMKEKLEDYLIRDDTFDPPSGKTTIQVANEIAESKYRYRLILFSNFITVGRNVEFFRQELETLFSDATAGTCFIFLGATGTNYDQIYNSLQEIALKTKLKRIPLPSNILGTEMDRHREQVIKHFQFRVFETLKKTLPMDSNAIRIINSTSFNTWKISSKKRTTFSLTIFRKGRWPNAYIV